MATLVRDELISALNRLGQPASANGDFVQLLAVGGSIMVLSLNARDSTKDVDAVIINGFDRKRFSEHVAEAAFERG